MSLALKVRPGTEPDTGAWKRRRDPFILGPFVDAIPLIHRQIERGVDVSVAIQEQGLRFATLHNGVRRFFEHALERYFDYHECREAQLGPLRWIASGPKIVKGQKQNAILTAWGALYESAAGDREMRRFRMTRARSTKTAWAYVAAHVAAETAGSAPVARVWVTEIGLLDGIEAHLLNGISPSEALDLYTKYGRGPVIAATAGVDATPCRGCSGCALTGACTQLIQMPSFAQSAAVGAWTRSLSASDLDLYETCPSRWYMEKEAHLPRDTEGSDSLLRGLTVHQWLLAAHARGIPCHEGDLPEPGQGLPDIQPDEMDDATYALAHPYLRAHIPNCPLLDTSLIFITAEQTVYGFDELADIVVATKADAVFKRDATLIIREVKTTHDLLTTDADGIFDRYLAVSWGLVALDVGMARQFGAADGEIQLEVITLDRSEVFTFRTDDTDLMKMARGRIRRLTERWLTDVKWDPQPNVGCTNCSVRRWCAARDQWSTRPVQPPDPSSDTDPPAY